MEKADENSPNPFVVKILTRNSCALKILQTPYCEPRAQQALQKVGGRGVSQKETNLTSWSCHSAAALESFLSAEIHRFILFVRI
jgi:hypothetical protein